MSDRQVRLPLPALRKRRWLARGRIWIWISLVAAIQLGAIFWLGQRQPIQPRPPAPGAGLKMVGSEASEVLELLDPTLFALPHEQGFSGAGWLIPEVQEVQPFAWSDPERWLSLSVTQLGAPLAGTVDTNLFEALPILARPEGRIVLPQIADTHQFPERSSMRLADGLASRRMLTGLDLPSWPNSELVSNSVVQLVVDGRGLPFSVTLIERSGFAEADKHALSEARKARFEPLGEAGLTANEMVWGTLVFEWHTVPALVNAAPPGRNR